MKKYIIPEMKLSRFESENVVTLASDTPSGASTAVEQAKAAADEIEIVKKVFSVTF